MPGTVPGPAPYAGDILIGYLYYIDLGLVPGLAQEPEGKVQARQLQTIKEAL